MKYYKAVFSNKNDPFELFSINNVFNNIESLVNYTEEKYSKYHGHVELIRLYETDYQFKEQRQIY